ncbi:MAG: 3-deoxy-8-phosphooctulonate synthase [Thermoanaerobaculia bacterium]
MKEKFYLFAGPCVIEDEKRILNQVEEMIKILGKFEDEIFWVFKASFDKANRTSLSSFRGVGLEKGMDIFKKIKEKFNVPVITDVHETVQVQKVSEVVDFIQIPAFLCRQTDLLFEAGRTGKPVNIKKGQFMAPEDMVYAVEKVKKGGSKEVFLTERGTTFGYHNLVVDMRSFLIMRNFGAKVIYDGTHSLQMPSGEKGFSGGRREFLEPLCKAAVAAGVDGLFLEVHPEPEKALSDKATQLPLKDLGKLLEKLLKIREAAK